MIKEKTIIFCRYKSEIQQLCSILPDSVRFDGKISIKSREKALKEFAEMQKENYKNAHITRLKERRCNVESGIAFLELLTIYEKMIDHCSNVSISTLNYMTNENFVTKQEFFKKIYETESELLKNKLNECSCRYAN